MLMASLGTQVPGQDQSSVTKPANLRDLLVEEKFERLKTFYEKGLNQIGWNKYSRISLEFNNQIICTKKEK